MSEEQPAKKAKKESSISMDIDFTAVSSLDPGLSWLNQPESATFAGSDGLKVTPKPGADFWCKSYRTPPHCENSGHALLSLIPADVRECCLQTEFTIRDHARYDQAGAMVYLDDTHWLKTGLEVEGGKIKMSCVVTNGASDWSYKAWPTKEAQMKITLKRYSGLCECEVECKNGDGWDFLRDAVIFYPDGKKEVDIRAGLLCAAPKKEKEGEGMDAFFKSLSIQEK